MQIDPVPKVCDVLRAFIRDSSYVVLVDEHDRRVMIIRRSQLLHIDYRTIGDPAGTFQP